MRREPTEEQLRAAWHAVARPEWGSYEQARTAWLHYSLAHWRARMVANGVLITEPAPAALPAHAPTVAAPAPHSWGSLRVTHTEPLFDRKRAAAGEREDD